MDEYGAFRYCHYGDSLKNCGDIEDEYERIEEPDIHKIADNTYLIRGNVLVEEVNERLLLNFDTDTEDYDTIAGMLIHALGHIPSEEITRTIIIDHCEFHIEKITNNRIMKVKLRVLTDSKK